MSENQRAHDVAVNDSGLHVCRDCGMSGQVPPPLPCPGAPLPNQVTLEQKRAALAALGIPEHGWRIRSVDIGVWSITVTMNARNDEGKIFAGNDRDVATRVHTIEVGGAGTGA